MRTFSAKSNPAAHAAAPARPSFSSHAHSVVSQQEAASAHDGRDFAGPVQPRSHANLSPAAMPPESSGFPMRGETRWFRDFSRVPVSAPTIQFELAVSVPGDPFEREADALADRVMRMEDPSSVNCAPPMIQRKCEKCKEEEEERQTLEGHEDEFPDAQSKTIFCKAAPSFGALSAPVTSQRLTASRASGSPLESAARSRMERSFGHDFSRVRVHHDSEAGAMTRQLSALAFTHGSHIYFGESMYRPHNPAGTRLLAHELAHVIQQGQAPRQSRAGENGGAGEVGRTSAPVLQRTATFSGATVHETNNLADVFLSGAVVGVTVQRLNGTDLGSTADARGAIVRPTVVFGSASTGGVNASVATVPTNTGSSDETVLGRGPWTRVVPKATVAAAFPALGACTGAGNSTFRAKGRPNDTAMFEANRRHENHHVADHTTVFNNTVGRWDTRLTAAQAAGTTFNGPTEAAAEAALHAAMGGTPDQIADALLNDRVAAARRFHGTALGGAVTTENPASDATCTTSEVTSFNPS